MSRNPNGLICVVPDVRMALQRAPTEEADMKGDRVEIVIDASGSTRTYDIEATRAGRRVEVT
ncbi:MAG: hypothetical protein M3Q22_09555, partial [Actinomycetota bacterium]|nr:hypothetical protein [Actinomycetota bacterium]